jgi:hypothetical protein
VTSLELMSAAGDERFVPTRRGQVFTPPMVARWLARRATEGLGTGGTVLDPAAGTGRLLAAVHQISGGAHRTIAIEVDPSAAALIPQLCPRAEVRVGDGLTETGDAVDAVVMNPPYGNADQLDSSFHQWASGRWSFHRRQLDVSTFFMAAALERLRPGARLACIVPRYWLEATGASGFRRWFARRAMVETVVDLGDVQVFPEADVLTALVVARRRGDGVTDDAATTFVRIADRAELDALLAELSGAPAGYPVRDLGAAPWFVRAPAEEAATRALESLPGRLGDFFRIGQGVKTGKNSVFVVSGAQADELGLRGPWLRRFARPRDIRAGDLVHADQWLIRLLARDAAPSGSLGRWIASHRNALDGRYQVRDGSVPWYAVSIPQNLELMEATPKLLHPLYARACRFAVDRTGYHVSTGAYALVPTGRSPVDLDEVAAWLNGPEVHRWMLARTKLKRDGYREFGRRALVEVPVPWTV